MTREAYADEGLPAFPGKDGNFSYVGMSLRDYFAAKAMQAIVAHQQHGEAEMTAKDDVAACAYELADAMLKAREA